MRTMLTFLILFFFSLTAKPQLQESFADGDFTNDPAWEGTIPAWKINGAGQLQSNDSLANSFFYLSTPNSLARMVQWEFYVRLNFHTSSANYVDVFLTASKGDLGATGTTGYFVRMGNTQDEISLYRKDSGSSITRIIDGRDGTTGSTANSFRIKVVREQGGLFSLFADAGGSGNNFYKEGSAADETYGTSSYFGLLVRQSTSSFFNKHYFDDIIIRPFNPDTTPPSIRSVTALSSYSLDVLFSEPVDPLTSQQADQYELDRGTGHPLSARRDTGNGGLVHLIFAGSFSSGTSHTLSIRGVKDLAGNQVNGQDTFRYYMAAYYDVVIDEIMADPDPPVALPGAEFIELINTSGHELNLAGWKIATSSAVSGEFPPFVLPADSFVIVCSRANASLFLSYGYVIGINGFPGLPNEGSLLALLSAEGKTVHALAYKADWYGQAIKSKGGWTLEMKDPHSPCSGAGNWQASRDAHGGTPGRKNSLDGPFEDQEAPDLLRTYSRDSTTLVALFSEPVDSSSVAFVGNYMLDNGPAIVAALPQAPLFNRVVLTCSGPMDKGRVYQLSVAGIKDCAGNIIRPGHTVKAGLAEEALSGDVVINEILSDPLPGGSDYVELFNRSRKIIDARNLLTGVRNIAGAAGNFVALIDSPFYIFPDEYAVVTQDAASLQRLYLVKEPGQVFETDLPSLPADKGTVVLGNSAGETIDEVPYSRTWQFALISDPRGIALERINPSGPSQSPDNWHSAASTAGYGTPTYKNSQFAKNAEHAATIGISPGVFSPDNDGHDDVAIIDYQVDVPGYLANVTIYDAAGRMVRYLVKNDLLGLQGSWKWDGLDEQSRRLRPGVYIVFTEVFHLQGRKMQFKNLVILAGKMQ